MKFHQIRGAIALFFLSATVPFVYMAGTVYGAANEDTAQKRLERSWILPSDSEKAIIRAKLAREHADTAAGLFSKAWIARRDGRAQEAKGMYEQCVAKYPTYLYCRANLAAEQSGNEKVENLREMLRIEPSFDDYSNFKTLYFTYRDGLKDEGAAAQVLADVRARYPDSYLLPYIDALKLEQGKDFSGAEQAYLAATKRGNAPFEVHKALADLRLEMAPKEPAALDRAMEGMREYLTYASALRPARRDLVYAAVFFLAEQLETRFKAYGQAFDMYEMAYSVHPSGEAAAAGFNLVTKTLDERLYDKAVELLERASSDLPGHYLVKAAEADHFVYRKNLQKAGEALAAAVDACPTMHDATRLGLKLGQKIYEESLFNYDRARTLYEKLLLETAGSDKRNVYTALYVDRRTAGDFANALKALNDLADDYGKSGIATNDAWFTTRRREMLSYLADENDSRRFYEGNPFLAELEKTFGGGLRLSINFAFNSDTVPPADYPKLAAAAKLLQRPGAESYIFAIEGHSDDTGPYSVNQPLSLRRAQSVMRSLNAKFGIPLERMKAQGFGSSLPVAPNTTRDLRTKNRRIEISALGNTQTPEIMVTTGLIPDGNLALSPDGRYFVAGMYPMQLWDAHFGVKVRDLGKGGGRTKFSPNGRYLAVSREWTEVGNHVETELEFVDVKTGLIVGRERTAGGVRAFDWDPYSQYVVYAEHGDNTLVIYDVAKRKKKTGTRLPGNAVATGITWLTDGLIVSGQAESRELLLWETESLRNVRQLGGVNWIHDLGHTRDLKYLVALDNKSTLSVWDTKSWNLRQMRVPVAIGRIYMHPEKHEALVTSVLEGAEAVTVDLDALKILATGVAAGNAAFGYSPDGKMIYRAGDNGVDVLDSRTLQSVRELRGMSVAARAGASDPKHGYFLSADAVGVHIWDIGSGKKIRQWDIPANSIYHLGDEPDRFIALVEDEQAQKTRIYTLNTATLDQSLAATVGYKVDRVASSQKVVAMTGKPFVPTHERASAGNGLVELFDRDTFAPRALFKVPFVPARLSGGAQTDPEFGSLDIDSESARALVVTSWTEGFKTGETGRSGARIFEIASGKELVDVTGYSNVTAASFDGGDPNRLKIVTDSGTYVHDVQSGKRLQVMRGISNEDVVSFGGKNKEVRYSRSFAEYRDLTGGETRYERKHGELLNVGIFEDRNLMVQLTRNNEMMFYDLTDFKPHLTIASKNGNEWIAYTPNGEFVASKKGTEKVFWFYGDNYVGFESLRQKNERPDLVGETLRAIAARRGVAGNP